MKKFLLAAVVLLGSISLANAERFSIGVTAKAGAFKADGASELFTGNHAGNRATTNIEKTNSEDAEAVMAMGSIFFEVEASDRISLGVNYVPHSMDTESTENIQNIGGLPAGPADDDESRNVVKLSFEDLTTIYAIADLDNNIYAKLGYVMVDIITDETLGTGGSYPNTDMDGFLIGVGYSMDLNDGMFARFEASYMDLDGATVVNDNDATKSVKADGITGVGAGISIGKSF